MAQDMKFWQRVAGLYTFMQERTNAALYARVADCCRPYITGETAVLELACGTGQFTFPLCGGAKSWEATDFSERMVQEGQRRNKTRAHFAVADATCLPYPDGSFDLVLVANALHVMPDPEAAMAEIHRVLRPEGLLLAPTFVYEGKINTRKLKLLERLGFKTYHKWDMAGLNDFIRRNGFAIEESRLLKEKMLPELFVCGRRK